MKEENINSNIITTKRSGLMKKWIFSFAFLVSSCAGSNGAIKYQENLQQWIGMPEPSLYDSWGMPTTVWNIDPQTKVVTYISRENTPINGDSDPYNGVGVDENGIPQANFGENLWDNQNDDYYCKTSFTITNGEVVNYNFNGDDCVVPVKW